MQVADDGNAKMFHTACRYKATHFISSDTDHHGHYGLSYLTSYLMFNCPFNNMSTQSNQYIHPVCPLRSHSPSHALLRDDLSLLIVLILPD